MVEPIVVRMSGILDEHGVRHNNDPEVVYIGRNLYMAGWKLKESKWHNPFALTKQNQIK